VDAYLEPDVVIPSASVGQFSLHEMSPGQWIPSFYFSVYVIPEVNWNVFR
jgi:hypothetical protein